MVSEYPEISAQIQKPTKSSILPNLSKDFERCTYNQIAQFFDKVLSKHQCGFKKGHNAQHSLIVLLEKWKESVDQGHVSGSFLTDLSKAFEFLPQNQSPTRDRKFGDLCHVIWKAFQHSVFKKAIKQWKSHACPCRLCRAYIYQVGFV